MRAVHVLVITLEWSEIMGRYNTFTDTAVGDKKRYEI